MPLVELTGVTKSYNGGVAPVHALRGVDLVLEAGQFVALMGPSGSGKSTLLSVLGAMTPPTGGTVCVDDIDVYQLDAERLADFRREYLGFVFQSLFLVPYLTALQNVMLPLAAARLPESRQQTMAMDALERVGLSRKAGRLPHDLSGGEPTGCLDSETGHSIIQLFRRLQEQGLSVFMVTHDAGVASCADRVLALRDGLLMSSCGDVTKEVVGARS